MPKTEPVVSESSDEQKSTESNSQEATQEKPEEKSVAEEEESWSEDLLMKNSRRFNIDLSPKVLFFVSSYFYLNFEANSFIS